MPVSISNLPIAPGERLAKGAAVIVRPVCYPMVRWRGEVIARTARGYRVRYACGGALLTGAFGAGEVQAL